MSEAVTIIKASGAYELSLDGSAERKRQALLSAADVAPMVVDASTQAEAFAVLVEIKKWLKQVEASRVEVGKPLLDWTREINRLAKDHCAPLVAAAEALDKMIARFVEEQRRQIAEEQRLKDEAIRLQLQIEEDAKWEAAQAAKALSKPDATEADLLHAMETEEDAKLAAQRTVATLMQPVITEPTRQAGMVVRGKVCWEVTNEQALYKVAPHFFRLEPNRAVINASVKVDTKLPGLKVWDETKIGART